MNGSRFALYAQVVSVSFELLICSSVAKMVITFARVINLKIFYLPECSDHEMET